MKGLVIKKIADFFYVAIDEEVYEAKPRGILKNKKQEIIVGDIAEISVLDFINKKAVIEKIQDRKNMLIRPNVSNITKLILVFSVKEPKLNPYLIDTFLVMAQKNNINVVLCFSKIDLDKDKDYKDIMNIYKNIGYETIEISSNENIGIENIKSIIKDDITVIAGPSGAGKSSLINKLSDNFNQETSDISTKLQKGKNTTTYVSLLKMSNNSYIADTPGFTSFKLIDIELNELKNYFIDFYNYTDCKFGNKCTHSNEPLCSVKKAVEEKNINESRYNSYIKMLEEIKRYEKRRKYK